jgi:lipoyl(octanoyl) transferase
MALDEALMERAGRVGEWTLRVYSWSTPTISLGRNQTARQRYDVDRIKARGMHVVRRPTGGRAILHHREITYSVTAPAGGAGDLRASYAHINELLLAALERVGVQAGFAAAERRASAPGMAPCFDEPASGELMVDGRKLAGSAQWRAEGALLQHGSILVADDQSTLSELTVGAQPAIPRPATLEALLGRAPSPSEVANAFVDTIHDTERTKPEPLAIDDELRARASALVVRYLDDAWTWRR